MNNGLIDCFIDKHSKKRLITEVFLELFTKEYIFLVEIAKVTKIGSSTLMTYLAEKGIYPVDHSDNKKLRLKLDEREKLKDISIFKGIV